MTVPLSAGCINVGNATPSIEMVAMTAGCGIAGPPHSCNVDTVNAAGAPAVASSSPAPLTSTVATEVSVGSTMNDASGTSYPCNFTCSRWSPQDVGVSVAVTAHGSLDTEKAMGTEPCPPVSSACPVNPDRASLPLSHTAPMLSRRCNVKATASLRATPAFNSSEALKCDCFAAGGPGSSENRAGAAAGMLPPVVCETNVACRSYSPGSTPSANGHMRRRTCPAPTWGGKGSDPGCS